MEKIQKQKLNFTPAVTIIILFGIISLFGDMVYEAARAANSQYFDLLGVSAAKVGLVFGIGEFLGYFLRLIAGLLSDRTGKHWLFIFIGYGMLVTVPLIGFTMKWNLIVVLVLMERIGKALRNPAKDTIISGVSESKVGLGFAFGIQEALDQIGAFLGPLIFTFVFYFSAKTGIAQYQEGYRMLLIPFFMLMLFIIFVYRKAKKEKLIPEVKAQEYHSEKLKPLFWIYTAFTFFCAFGFVNFSVIGYHLKAENLLSDGNITLLYSFAMGIDAMAALVTGKIYDRLKDKSKTRTGGLAVLLFIPLATILLPVLTLGRSVKLIVAGMVLFGIIMGMHETIMRSAIADITPFHKRGTGYGVFNAGYGIALLGGAALMGMFYDMKAIWMITAMTFLTEIIALILYIKMRKMSKTY